MNRKSTSNARSNEKYDGKAHLLAKVVINKSGLDGQISRRVQWVSIIVWRFNGSFIDSQQIEFGVISLIHEQFAANLFNDDIPRVIWSCAAHNRCQNCVGSINIAFRFGQLTNDWIISCCDSVEDAVNALQWTFIFHIDTVIRFIVEFQSTATTNIFALFDAGQWEFQQTWKIHLLNGHPIGAHSDWSITNLWWWTTSSPFACDTAPIVTNFHILIQLLHSACIHRTISTTAKPL